MRGRAGGFLPVNPADDPAKPDTRGHMADCLQYCLKI
uniref:Uncharacterized protein n=1 Tax=Neisseria meningitidis alpha153 TaxID=663926 RepID=C6SF62_NEIME|nr:hypothetical protein predicted by Glimmer/Critica [Neisseria meningitidis alpha153]